MSQSHGKKGGTTDEVSGSCVFCGTEEVLPLPTLTFLTFNTKRRGKSEIA